MERLEYFYTSVPLASIRLPWKLYDTRSHKLICEDYGAVMTDEFDNLLVKSVIKRKGYWAVYVC